MQAGQLRHSKSHRAVVKKIVSNRVWYAVVRVKHQYRGRVRLPVSLMTFPFCRIVSCEDRHNDPDHAYVTLELRGCQRRLVLPDHITLVSVSPPKRWLS